MPSARSPVPLTARLNSPMRPMLATTAARPPHGPGWVHEVKWDGMRLLVDIRGEQVRLSSRNGKDATVSFPELAGLAGTFDDLLLDAEVVALDGGVPSFAALAERMHVADRRRADRLAATRPVTLMIFDILRLFGQDLTGQPWSARRELLERLELAGPHWQVPPVYADGAQLLAATQDQGLEGVVSKRRAAAYLPGRRSADWVKVSNRHTVSAVVGGWRPETGSATRLGAVLLGTPGPDGLRYLGRMGSGLAGRAGTMMRELLAPLAHEESPFADGVPVLDARGTFWVRPGVVVEVRSLGETGGGRLRHPTYVGVRHDLAPDDLWDD